MFNVYCICSPSICPLPSPHQIKHLIQSRQISINKKDRASRRDNRKQAILGFPHIVEKNYHCRSNHLSLFRVHSQSVVMQLRAQLHGWIEVVALAE